MRHGMKLWTDDDDAALTGAVVDGSKIDAIATELGRTPAGIRNRAYVLRLKLGKKRDPAAEVPRLSQSLRKKQFANRLVELGLKKSK